MTYKEKLQDPRWQQRRLHVMQRDGWKCLCCGASEKQLQVHHIVYRKCDPWDVPEYLLQTLCKDCHEERQFTVDALVDAVRIALKDVPTRRLKTVCQRLMAEATEEIAASTY